jgi:hypothetical protein
MNPNGITAALKRAFLWHWHLLALSTAVGFATLSGQVVNLMPLLAAGELAYLGFLGLQPRFQNVLRGTTALKKQPLDNAERFQQLASFLSPDDLSRFQHLHARCSALLALRRSMDSKDNDPSVQNFRGESLDRMLWLFLKLLHQKTGLERFIASTKRSQTEFDLKLAEEQLATSKQRDATAGGVEGRLTSSINERITTIRERLANFDKAGDSLELVGAEIDKTEQQITHLCEVGMTARDSASLSAQVDSISASLQTSEKTFAHESIESLFDDDTAPPLFSGGINVALPTPSRKTILQ